MKSYFLALMVTALSGCAVYQVPAYDGVSYSQAGPPLPYMVEQPVVIQGGYYQPYPHYPRYQPYQSYAPLFSPVQPYPRWPSRPYPYLGQPRFPNVQAPVYPQRQHWAAPVSAPAPAVVQQPTRQAPPNWTNRSRDGDGLIGRVNRQPAVVPLGPDKWPDNSSQR